MVDVVNDVAVDPKEWPEDMPCELDGCRGILKLVSIDEGYTCSNKHCPNHMEVSK